MKGGRGGGDYGGFKIGFHVGWELKAVVQVHGSFTQSDVDCFCSSPLPVSIHNSLNFGTVPVDGMLGLVGMNCYAIPRVSPLHCLFVFPNSYPQGALRFTNLE